MGALGLSWEGTHLKESEKRVNAGPVKESSKSKRSESKFSIRFIMQICFLALMQPYPSPPPLAQFLEGSGAEEESEKYRRAALLTTLESKDLNNTY